VLAQKVGTGEVNLFWMSPTLFVTSRRVAEAGSVPLACPIRAGSSLFHSVLFVAEDSPIQGIRDLGGKRVAWVGPASAAGYVFPRIHLAARGMNPLRMFREEVFCQTHGAVVTRVLSGQADVGATFAHIDAMGVVVRAGFTLIPADKLPRILEIAGPIPSDVIAAANLPAPLRRAIAEALRMASGTPSTRRALTRFFGASDFEPYSVAASTRLAELARIAEDAGLSGEG
jgi:ABC-type phosphate/phosphonate transport system substrate-binding protein